MVRVKCLVTAATAATGPSAVSESLAINVMVAVPVPLATVYEPLLFVELVIVIVMLILLFVLLGGMGFLTDIQTGQFDKLLQYTAVILVASLVALLLYLPLVMAFWFAPALVALGNIKAFDAMQKSFAGCLVNMVPYLLYGVVGLILSLLASIPLGLGWLILCPMIVASIYLSYRDIFEGSSQQRPTNH